MTVTLAHVQAAARAIADDIRPTPTVDSPGLSALLDAQVVLKLENRQFTGAFKERGALNRLLALDETERRRGVVAVSAGNHAQGVAYHARRLGIPASIVMPATTPLVKVRRTERFGARVVLAGDSLGAAHEHARRLEAQEDRVFVHPYADPLVIAGQGTVALEMLAADPDLQVLVVPIGGGGLISGVATAAKGLNPAIRVVGVQAELYPAIHAALRGEQPTMGGHSIAEGIAVKEAHPMTLALIRERVDEVLLVCEEAIERAICLLLEVEKNLAEGAGAAGLAALLSHPQRFRGQRVGLIVCGGNIDQRLLASVLMRDLVRQGRIARLRVPLLDNVGELATVARLIADSGGNIVEVIHQRLLPHLPAKDAALEVAVEVRDAPQLEIIRERLGAAGYTVEKLGD